MDFYNHANSLYVDEEYVEAIDAYTSAIAENKSCAAYFAKRCNAYFKLGKYAKALQDSEEALRLDASNAATWLKKGMCLFETNDFKGATVALQCGARLAQKSQPTLVPIYNTWLRKCQVETDDTTINLEEKPTSAPTPTPSPTKTKTKDSNVIVGKQGKVTAPAVEKAAPASIPTPAPVALSPAAPTSRVPESSFKHKFDWYQTMTHVTITVMIKGLSEDGVKVEVDEPTHLKVVIGGDESDMENVLLLDLCGPVSMMSDDVITRIRPSKMEIKIKKTDNTQWAALTEQEAGASGKGTIVGNLQAAMDAPLPTPYSNKGKDWSKIEKELDEEEKPEGEGALNAMFQQIYKGADEETRRAMVKSFQTSGGTCLSTNWDEVGEKDYEKEKTAPEGMQWQKWDN